jgi:excisionase family DNA binding protein
MPGKARNAREAPPELPHLLDVHALAEHLGNSTRHVRRLVAERRIPYLKVGGFIRFDPAEIAHWLDEQRQPSIPDAVTAWRQRRSASALPATNTD